MKARAAARRYRVRGACPKCGLARLTLPCRAAQTVASAVAALTALQGTPIGGPSLRIEYAKTGTPSRSVCVTGLSRAFTHDPWAAQFAVRLPYRGFEPHGAVQGGARALTRSAHPHAFRTQRYGPIQSLQFNDVMASALVEYATVGNAVDANNAMQGQSIGGQELKVAFETAPTTAPARASAPITTTAVASSGVGNPPCAPALRATPSLCCLRPAPLACCAACVGGAAAVCSRPRPPSMLHHISSCALPCPLCRCCRRVHAPVLLVAVCVLAGDSARSDGHHPSSPPPHFRHDRIAVPFLIAAAALHHAAASHGSRLPCTVRRQSHCPQPTRSRSSAPAPRHGDRSSSRCSQQCSSCSTL